MDWESKFKLWGQSPSRTEQEKMENAESAVKNAIEASETLNRHNIRVFPQGSYRNRTNVKQDSDVDICVLCTDTFYFHLPNGTTRDQFGLNDPPVYHDAEYRRDVENALVSYFGSQAVTAGNKAWDIHQNTYRVNADVVACFEYRYYYSDGSYQTGTAVLPRSGFYIVNFPEQNYLNSKQKNDDTSRRFRVGVRIMKNLCNEMYVNGDASSKNIPSYFLECLIWNVPNEGFNRESYLADIRWILAHLCNETRQDEMCKDWCEINGFKYLFHSSQRWNRVQANSFLNAAWRYIGFKD